MSFWKSFLRETGKNSGKWVSNKIFKEGWSTPYRFNKRLDSIEQKQSRPSKLQQKDIPRKENKKQSIDHPVFTKNVQNDNLNKLTNDILNLNIPDEKQEIIDVLEYLMGVVQFLQWNTDKKSKLKNNISDTSLKKYEIALNRLKLLSHDDYLFFNQELKKLQKKRFRQKYLLLIAVVVFFIIFYCFVFGGLAFIF
jgi:hypothetical protein